MPSAMWAGRGKASGRWWTHDADMHRTYRPPSATLAALASLDLLAGAPRHALVELTRYADLIDLPAGDVIDRAGTGARQLVGIVDGYVRGVDRDGNAVVLGPGEQFGATELLERRPHSMTYTTVTPTTAVVVFGPAFRAAVAGNDAVRDVARLDAEVRASVAAVAPVPALTN